MEKIEVWFDVAAILADKIQEEDEDGSYEVWEEYDTQTIGRAIVLTDEEDTPSTQDELIESLKQYLVRGNLLTQEEVKRVIFQTNDKGLTFEVSDWDWKPLYRFVLI